MYVCAQAPAPIYEGRNNLYIDGTFSLFLDLTALNPHLIPYYPFTATTPARLTIAQHAAATQQVAAMLPSAGGLRADKLEVSSSVLFISYNCPLL